MTLVLQALYRLDLSPVEVAMYFDWYSVPTRRRSEPNMRHLMNYLVRCALIYNVPIPLYALVLTEPW